MRTLETVAPGLGFFVSALIILTFIFNSYL